MKFGMIDLRPPCRTFPRDWKLSPAQDRILTQLAHKGQASKKVIAYLASPRGCGRGSVEAVKAHISILRRALNGAGAPVRIHNIRGWGYQIDRPGQDYLRRFLREKNKREAA